MLREPIRWQTHFGQWVTDVGAHELSQRLAAAGAPVTPDAVYKWVAGAHVPRIEVALHLVALAEGRLEITDVLLHRFELARIRAGQPGGPPSLS